MSGKLAFKHGVSQGSVLGTLLFVILVNDLGNGRVSYPCSADDTRLLSIGRTSQQAMEVALRDFRGTKAEWFTVNNLLLNKTKTQFVHPKS